MKKFCLLLVTLFAQISFAEIQIDLKADGIFTQDQITIKQGMSKKACREAGGTYLKRKKCRLTEVSSDSVSVQKNEFSDTYIVRVSKKMASGELCTFEGYGALRNQVQIFASTDQCDMTIGYTSPSTLSAWSERGCECADGSKLMTSELRRTGSL